MQIKKLNILCLPIYDWKETHPLGKAEWIKFIGYLVGKQDEANDYFKHLEIRYNLLKKDYSKRKGPTGVGFTLETLLGITENNRQAPDYKGIELKAGRLNHKMPRSRTTLFSKIPDWSKSACSSGMLLLENYGYLVDGRRQLCREKRASSRLWIC